MAGEQFSLCWDNFHKNMSAGMHALLENEDLVDVTIAIEGKYLKAHKMVLSVCSPYFKELFQSSPCKHPIVFLKDVSYVAMNDLLTFMYQGEVQVNQEHLTAFIKTAEALQVKGLTGEAASEPTEIIDDTPEEEQIREIDIKPTTPRPKKLVPYSNKRPRHTSNTESKMPKLDHCTPSEIIQFKMEPFEGGQTHHEEHFQAIDDSHPDGYRDTLDETQLEESHIDDPEDYSMLEGEEEPKPGTSADPGGDSQEQCGVPVKTDTALPKLSSTSVVVGGFVYHQNSKKQNSKVRYLVCSEYKRLGCKVRLVLPEGSTGKDVTVSRPHCHPPTKHIEDKQLFMKSLRRLIECSPNSSLRSIYDDTRALYARGADECPYNKVISTMRRWQKEALANNLYWIGSRFSERVLLNVCGPYCLVRNQQIVHLTTVYEGDGKSKKGDGPRCRKPSSRFVANGFVYHTNAVAGSPPLRYLGCAIVKKSGCKGRATIPVGADLDELRVTHGHNHPPDVNAEEKDQFIRELKRVARIMEQSTLKHIYETVAEFFPNAAEEISFRSISSSIHRWKKIPTDTLA